VAKTTRTLKIGTHDVPVRIIDADELYEIIVDHGEDDNGQCPLGACTQGPEGYQILLMRGVTPQMRGVVIIHEIIEAMNIMYDLNMSHHAISTLSESLVQVERDNRKVLRALK